MKTIKRLLIFFSLISILILLVFLNDIREDRKFNVQILKDTFLYDEVPIGSSSAYQKKVAILLKGEHLQVLRIVYGKDYMAIKVRKNKIEGWLLVTNDVKISK